MMMDITGNALGAWSHKALAAKALQDLVEVDPTAAEEVIVIEYDRHGKATGHTISMSVK